MALQKLGKKGWEFFFLLEGSYKNHNLIFIRLPSEKAIYLSVSPELGTFSNLKYGSEVNKKNTHDQISKTVMLTTKSFI